MININEINIIVALIAECYFITMKKNLLLITIVRNVKNIGIYVILGDMMSKFDFKDLMLICIFGMLLAICFMLTGIYVQIIN